MTDMEAEVADLERRRCAAINARDAEAIGATLAEDYLHCHATGLVHDKAAVIAHILSSPRAVQPRMPAIRMYGETAVLTGPLVNVSEREGAEPTKVRLFVTQVARRDADGWRFVSFQSTKLPAE
jgi:ketosteroid isomerase-like protein